LSAQRHSRGKEATVANDSAGFVVLSTTTLRGCSAVVPLIWRSTERARRDAPLSPHRRLENEVLARDAGALLLVCDALAHARDGDTPALHQQAAQARQVLERSEVDTLTPSQPGKIEGGGDAACKGETGAGGAGGGDFEAPRMLISSLCLTTNFSQQYPTIAALRHESLVP
jgi:hypothetical protein